MHSHNRHRGLWDQYHLWYRNISHLQHSSVLDCHCAPCRLDHLWSSEWLHLPQVLFVLCSHHTNRCCCIYYRPFLHPNLTLPKWHVSFHLSLLHVFIICRPFPWLLHLHLITIVMNPSPVHFILVYHTPGDSIITPFNHFDTLPVPPSSCMHDHMLLRAHIMFNCCQHCVCFQGTFRVW